ncbi:hypothetical protein KIPB_016688, partial [Kipferlia bialata]|eukprot:g16688.t1
MLYTSNPRFAHYKYLLSTLDKMGGLEGVAMSYKEYGLQAHE